MTIYIVLTYRQSYLWLLGNMCCRVQNLEELLNVMNYKLNSLDLDMQLDVPFLSPF